MEQVNRKRRRRFYEARSKEELQNLLIQLYEDGSSQHDIARKLDVPRGTLSRWMVELAIKGRECGEAGKAGKAKSKKYTYDEDFFHAIDTPDKAYIVGFINGDGYIVDRSKSKRLGIAISIDDRQVLDDIASYMHMEDMIKLRQPTYANEKEKVSLIVNCTKMCNDLIELGIHPKKTGQEKWIPFLNESLQWAFLRGMFDADGHIRIFHRKGRTQGRFGITSSADFLTEAHAFLKSYGIGLRVTTLCQKQGCYDLYINARKDLRILYRYLYQDGNLKLNRKYERFSSLMI